MVVRNGLAEMPARDQANMTRRSMVFEGVKLASEFAGLRTQRFTLHAPEEAPAGAKRIYFVRHGEGEHNAWRAAEIAEGRTPTAKRHNVGKWPPGLHDPLLTAKGHEDGAAAAVTSAELPMPLLLVTSPMRRAVQTMTLTFGDALAAGVPAIAHELCREAFHGTDPSVYDSRLSRDELAAAYPSVDFLSHVLPTANESTGPVHDPLWWHCASPFGHRDGARGIDEAGIVEHAYRFLEWLMARPEPVIGVATHSNFLLALHHGCLDGCPSAAQVFHTGELRVLTVSAAPLSKTERRAYGGMFGPDATLPAAPKSAGQKRPADRQLSPAMPASAQRVDEISRADVESMQVGEVSSSRSSAR